MNVILGASGQIGSQVVQNLTNLGQPVKAIVRKPKAREGYLASGIESETADLIDLKSIKQAIKNGKTLFVLTPEDPLSNDIFWDIQKMLDNVKKAIADSEIERIVGLSSFGAQHSEGTGNLALSYVLEHSFDDLPIDKVFIRPAYYYSNWLAYIDAMKQRGVLPTLFPPDLKIPMAAPTDVAAFIADVIRSETIEHEIIEIMGPDHDSSNDVARIYGKILHKDIVVNAIPQREWKDMFVQFGATESYSNSLAEMTKAVIGGKAVPEKPEGVIRLKTTLDEYLKTTIS